MKTNARGIALIKAAEGLRLKAYLCPAGVPTIGYGHTSQSVKIGQTITEHVADVVLESDLERFEEGVGALCPGLTANQFSACVSFAFNFGLTAFANSTLRKKILKGDMQGAAAEFSKWVNAAGKQLPGLVKRRALERELFCEP